MLVAKSLGHESSGVISKGKLEFLFTSSISYVPNSILSRGGGQKRKSR